MSMSETGKTEEILFLCVKSFYVKNKIFDCKKIWFEIKYPSKWILESLHEIDSFIIGDYTLYNYKIQPWF